MGRPIKDTQRDLVFIIKMENTQNNQIYQRDRADLYQTLQFPSGMQHKKTEYDITLPNGERSTQIINVFEGNIIPILNQGLRKPDGTYGDLYLITELF